MRRKSTPQKAAMTKALDDALSWTGTHHGSSRWSEMRRCPRGHQLRFSSGLRLKTAPDYFAIGHIVHAGLAYAGQGEIEGFPWSVDDVIDSATKQKLFGSDVIEEGRRLLQAYFGYWGTENAGYGKDVQLLEVEHFVSSKKLAQRYTGRLDTLVLAKPKKRAKERLVIFDHKTIKSVSDKSEAELVRFLASKPQFLGLAYCIREIEGELPVMCVNFIGKTKIPKFRRVTFEWTNEDLDRWADNHDRSLKLIEADWMNYSECSPPIGLPCWAFGWCHGTEEERAELYQLPTQTRRKSRANEKEESEATR